MVSAEECEVFQYRLVLANLEGLLEKALGISKKLLKSRSFHRLYPILKNVMGKNASVWVKTTHYMLIEAIGYYGMGSEIGNGACKYHDQYGPPKHLIPKNVSPLAFTIWRAHPARVASTFLRCC